MGRHKRVVIWVLLFALVSGVFVGGINHVDASANSNDRRKQFIDLANGKSLLEIDNISDIDIDSLRAVALYLSNFYVPYSTVLGQNGDTSELKDDMIQALTAAGGMQKDAAEYLVSYVLDASLNTCKQLYVRKIDLDNYVKSFYGVADDQFKSSVPESTTSKTYYIEDLCGGQFYEYARYCAISGVGFGYSVTGVHGTRNKSDLSNTVTSGLGFSCSSVKLLYYVPVMCLEEGQLDFYGWVLNPGLMDYFNSLGGVKEISGLSYVPVSYSFFMQLMGEPSPSTKDNSKVSVIEFYWINENGEIVPCFSNNEFCRQAFGVVTDTVAFKNGIGSGFCLTTMADFGSMDDRVKLKSLVLGQTVYVNWVGDLILNDNDKQYVILPGCANPYMFSEIDGKVGQQYDFVNFYYINKIISGDIYIDTVKTDDYTVGLCSNQLYTMYYWCIQRGSSLVALDQSDKANNWGAGQNLIDFIESTDYLGYSYTNNDVDPISFPIWLDRELCNTSRSLSLVSIVYPTGGTTTELHDLVSVGDVFEITRLASGDYINFSSILDYGNTAVYRTNATLRELFRALFITYAFAYFNKDATVFDAEQNIINLKVNVDNFPLSNSNLVWNDFSIDSTADEVMSFVYYLLHPTKGISYVATWVKNKVSGIFVGWHEDIVGGSASNATTGMTQYLGFSGYVTTPNLFDIDWISSLLSGYNSIVVYLIIIIAVVLLSYVIIGQLTVQRALIGLFMFGVLAFIPPVAINTVVNLSNQAADTIYSSKFDYWALVQLQNYIGLLNNQTEAKQNGDVNDYIASIIQTNAVTSSGVGGESEVGYTGVKLKWISPKKFNAMAGLSTALDNTYSNNNMWLKQMVLASVNQATSGETFLDSDNALYIYRDALDLYRYASCAYNLYSSYSCVPSAGGRDLRNNDSPLLHIAANETLKGLVSHWASTDVYHSYLKNIKYSSGQSLSKYIICNLEDSTTYNASSDAVRDTTSLNAIRKGFLIDTVNLKAMETNANMRVGYYQQTGSLASSLFLNYGYILNEVDKQYSRLKQVVSSSSELAITWDSLKSTAGVDSSNFFGVDNSLFEISLDMITAMRTTPYSGTTAEKQKWYRQFSGLYYELYTESPFFFFSFNTQDQMWRLTGNGCIDSTRWNIYYYDPDSLGKTKQNFKDMLLSPNQSYFFNMEDGAGDGYGELRDFMNFHDLFYYIMPSLGDSVELCRLFDDVFGLYLYDDCNLKVNSAGEYLYDGTRVDFSKDDFNTYQEGVKNWASFTDEEKYKFWHNYNVIGIMNAYCAWLDTMYDCDYAKGQTIPIMGQKYYVEHPLDPTSYYKLDKDGNMVEGRYMVFSRSEMAYYGLRESDLTTVERKIIEVQDNVYKKSIDLLNYYTLSDEVLIQSYALLQTFEFDKVFSQTSLVGEDFILYPQGYELKAFTYDAYLRLIIAGAAGEDIMSSETASDGTNVSIYQRVLQKTSLFFGIVLLINDFVAVYLIPGLKLFFLIAVFLLSIFMIISSAIKLELNLLTVTMKCLVAPLGAFAAISVGMAWLVSLFMSGGGQGVTRTSTTIYIGDPTMVIIVMVIINVAALVLYWKLCKKCFKDAVKFAKAVFANMGGAVVGAINRVVGSVAAGKIAGRAYAKAAGAGAAGTAKQRGEDNKPTSGKSGLGTAFAAGAAGGLAAGAAQNKAQDAVEGSVGKANKYNSKIVAANNAYNQSKNADKKQSAQGKFESRMQAVDDRLDKAADAKEVFLHGKGLSNRMKAGLVAAKEGVGGRKDQLVANAKYAGGRLARRMHIGSDESYETQMAGARLNRLKKDGRDGSELRPEQREKKKAAKEVAATARREGRVAKAQERIKQKSEAKTERAQKREETRAAKSQRAAERAAMHPRMNMAQKSSYHSGMAAAHTKAANQKMSEAASLRNNGHKLMAAGMMVSSKASRIKAAASSGASRAYARGNDTKTSIKNTAAQVTSNAKITANMVADGVKNSNTVTTVKNAATTVTNKVSATAASARGIATGIKKGTVNTVRRGADRVASAANIVRNTAAGTVNTVRRGVDGVASAANTVKNTVSGTVAKTKDVAVGAASKVQGAYNNTKDSVSYAKKRYNVYNERLKVARKSALERAMQVKPSM